MKGLPWIVCFLLVPSQLLAQAGPLVLPGDDLGEGHYGEPPAGAVGGDWLGLYVRGDSSWVQSVTVTLDVRPSDEPEAPGTHEYLVDPTDPALILTGVVQARVGPVQTSLRYTEAAFQTSRSREFTLGSVRYQLAFEGGSHTSCDGVVTLSDGQAKQSLYDAAEDTTFACDEPRYDVHWAGDLDGDSRLDLLATFSSKYSYHPRRLYLSSAASDGELVRAVSLFER